MKYLKNTLIFVQACPEDALNELTNELNFTFEGLPSFTNLRPSLPPQAQTTSIHPVCVFLFYSNFSYAKKKKKN